VDGNSSVNTPKFANSFSSTTPPALENVGKTIEPTEDKKFNRVVSQVDDFPKLIE
jgi:hypothetical protein